MTLLATSLAAFCLACQEPPKSSIPEGVYTMCEEVEGFSGETIELKGGKFRYWFYTDVGTDDAKYPLTGTYRVERGKLILEHEKIRRYERIMDTVNGVDVLWREDGLKIWKEDKRLYPYAVLLRVPGATDGSNIKERPSLESLKTKELKDRDKAEYEARFNDLPVEVRTLLRARTLKGDPNMDTYRNEVAKARIGPDPKLLSQLVALLHRDSPTSIKAGMILDDLYLETWLMAKAPPFSKDDAAKKKALEGLIEALSSARDRDALENTIILFLQVSGAGPMNLSVEGAGVEVVLSFRPDGAKVYSSSGPADDVGWVKVIAKVIPECQKWMRAKLSK